VGVVEGGQMRVIVGLCLALAIATSVATAVLILRLPDPGPGGAGRSLLIARDQRAQNRERRNEYLGAGGIVVVTLLGAAVIVGRMGGSSAHP
jgi:hypothetical protein